MSKDYLKQRNASIRKHYDTLRDSGLTIEEAIKAIQADPLHNPTGLSFEYIRRWIVFRTEKKSVTKYHLMRG